jgi:hypothetical protein
MQSVLHTSPHTAEHREKPEVSKKFLLGGGFRGIRERKSDQITSCARRRSLIPEVVLQLQE